MKKLILKSLAATVLPSLFSMAALAQGAVFYGAVIDPAAVPRDVVSVPTVVNPAGDAPEQGGTPRIVAPTLYSVYNAGPCDAFLRSGWTGTLSNPNCDSVGSGNGSSVGYGFPVHLPAGAVVSYARIYFTQTVLTETIPAGFWKRDHFGVGTLVTGMMPTATTAGNTVQEFGPFTEVINDAPDSGYTYNFLAVPQGASRVYKMTLYYKLQVSPAPASASFIDVPTSHWAFQHIEALKTSGITSGCGAGIYCPDNNVTRAEMAVFLGRALGLAYQY